LREGKERIFVGSLRQEAKQNGAGPLLRPPLAATERPQPILIALSGQESNRSATDGKRPCSDLGENTVAGRPVGA
jgi:hypothetical protein